MSGSFDQRGHLEIGDGKLIVCVGKKRSGKSVMGHLLAQSFPGDLIVLDIAGDDGPSGRDVVELHGTVDTLPRRWPEHLRPDKGGPMVVRYRPDAGSPTFLNDMDAIVGLALSHGRASGRCCLLVHEMGVLAKANSTPPHTRRMLMHNRHHRLTGIFCMPRPKVIDPLVLSQADLTYIFDVPNPDDRARIAHEIGWDPRDFDDAWRELRRHEYLRNDANEPRPEDDESPDYRLVHFPALPEDVVRGVLRRAHGEVEAESTR